MPRSPWLASPGCMKNAGVPVEASVEAILRPMWPDLPMPVTTTRPLVSRIMRCAGEERFAEAVLQRAHRVGLDVEHAARELEKCSASESAWGCSRFVMRESINRFHDARRPSGGPDPARLRGRGGGALPPAVDAGDPRLPHRGRGHRPARARLRSRDRKPALPGGIRRGLPHVLRGARVQPAAADHAPHRVRLRRRAGGRGDRARHRRLDRRGALVARGHHRGRRARDVLDRDHLEDARRAHAAAYRLRPPDHGRAAVPGPRGDPAPGADPGARPVERRSRSRSGSRW